MWHLQVDGLSAKLPKIPSRAPEAALLREEHPYTLLINANSRTELSG
jgi:hypothetical protein